MAGAKTRTYVRELPDTDHSSLASGGPLQVAPMGDAYTFVPPVAFEVDSNLIRTTSEPDRKGVGTSPCGCYEPAMRVL